MESKSSLVAKTPVEIRGNAGSNPAFYFFVRIKNIFFNGRIMPEGGKRNEKTKNGA